MYIRYAEKAISPISLLVQSKRDPVNTVEDRRRAVFKFFRDYSTQIPQKPAAQEHQLISWMD